MEKKKLMKLRCGSYDPPKLQLRRKKNICSNGNLAKDLSQRGYYLLEH